MPHLLFKQSKLAISSGCWRYHIRPNVRSRSVFAVPFWTIFYTLSSASLFTSPPLFHTEFSHHEMYFTLITINVLYYYYSTHLRSPTITLRPRPRPFPGAESCLFFCRRSKTRTSPASGCRFFGASTPRRLWCFGFACLLL